MVLNPGELLRVELASGVAVIVYVGQSRSCGDVIFVPDGKLDVAEQGRNLDGYFAYYPAQEAVRGGLMTVSGGICSPPAVPSVFRVPGSFEGKEIVNWLITRESSGDTENVVGLTPDQARLPIGVIWGHSRLVEALETGWRPEQDQGVDSERFQEIKTAKVVHRLVFGHEDYAHAFAESIEVDHEKVEVDLDAKGWSMVVVQRNVGVVKRAIDKVSLRAMARKFKGKYRGWELITLSGEVLARQLI